MKNIIEKESQKYFKKAVETYPEYSSLENLAFEMEPICISDFKRISVSTLEMLARHYKERGIVHFKVLNPDDTLDVNSHPLCVVAAQLAEFLPLKHPITHPLEFHSKTLKLIGAPDGTLKIFDNKKKGAGYIEVAETSKEFAAHNDGLGYAGRIECVGFYVDSPPLTGGQTFFQNIVKLALQLKEQDEEAYVSLFHPHAIEAFRPRGKGAIKVKSPVLFVDEQDCLNTFYRQSSGEYVISFDKTNKALCRAFEFLDSYCKSGADGSVFTRFSEKGLACICNNKQFIHGRSGFENGNSKHNTRVLARKWFMTKSEYTKYFHVPGIAVNSDFAKNLPTYFSPQQLLGEWHFDSIEDKNKRIA